MTLEPLYAKHKVGCTVNYWMRMGGSLSRYFRPAYMLSTGVSSVYTRNAITTDTARFVERNLTDAIIPFPIHKFPTIQALGEAVLRSFKRRSLRYANKMGTGAIARPPEACYQDEFHRALRDVLGFSTIVSSEWSGSKEGRIDFYIPQPG